MSQRQDTPYNPYERALTPVVPTVRRSRRAQGLPQEMNEENMTPDRFARQARVFNRFMHSPIVLPPNLQRDVLAATYGVNNPTRELIISSVAPVTPTTLVRHQRANQTASISRIRELMDSLRQERRDRTSMRFMQGVYSPIPANRRLTFTGENGSMEENNDSDLDTEAASTQQQAISNFESGIDSLPSWLFDEGESQNQVSGGAQVIVGQGGGAIVVQPPSSQVDTPQRPTSSTNPFITPTTGTAGSFDSQAPTNPLRYGFNGYWPSQTDTPVNRPPPPPTTPSPSVGPHTPTPGNFPQNTPQGGTGVHPSNVYVGTGSIGIPHSSDDDTTTSINAPFAFNISQYQQPSLQTAMGQPPQPVGPISGTWTPRETAPQFSRVSPRYVFVNHKFI